MIMNVYRITKYNPRFRNSDDVFLNHEWTSYSDIGKTFNGAVLSKGDYIKVEKQYIDFCINIMNRLKISTVTIIELESHHIIGRWKKGMKISNTSKLRRFFRDCLREKYWGIITHDKLTVKFGYDYYMYVKTSMDNEQIKQIAESFSLFCEEIDTR